MSRLVSELEMCFSAVDMQYQGIPNSMTAKTMIQRAFLRSTGICRRAITMGVKSSEAGAVRKSTMTPGSSWRTATRISKYGMPQITAIAKKRVQPRRDMAFILVAAEITCVFMSSCA